MDITQVGQKRIFELNQITNRLVSLVEIDQLYYSNCDYEETSIKELLVLIPKVNRQHITEVRPLIGMIMCKFSHFRYQVYYVDEVRRSIILGGGAFIKRCDFGNLIYINPKSSLVMPNVPDLQLYLQKAEKNFKMECCKINAFWEGAEFYFKRRYFQLCTFMLHQVFELLYRMAEIVFLGREKISHYLRKHHQLMLPYLPALQTIFDANQEHDMYLLKLLDDAYLSVRYENNYKISLEDLEYLFMKCKAVKDLSISSCSKMISKYQKIGLSS